MFGKKNTTKTPEPEKAQPAAQMYRHGDVLLRRIHVDKSAIKPLQPSPLGEGVLALGEVTGHKHVISNSIVYGAKGVATMLVTDGGTLTHEEHGPIEIPAGTYEVIGQREYQPSGISRVVD